MTQPGEPRWLSEPEMQSWLPFVRLLTVLPAALDAQLREEAGISHVYYQVLALLSSTGGAARMSDLALRAGTSSSRLSHAVASLEERGWVERRRAEEDGRGQVAHLTDAGRQVLAAAAPGHVAEVRRRVLDPLSPEQVEHLGEISRCIAAALDRLQLDRPQLDRP